MRSLLSKNSTAAFVGLVILFSAPSSSFAEWKSPFGTFNAIKTILEDSETKPEVEIRETEFKFTNDAGLTHEFRTVLQGSQMKETFEKVYAPDGRLERESHSVGQTQLFVRHYYPDGKVKEEAFYDSGKLNGTHKKFSPEGKLVLWYTYRRGKRNGVCRDYYADGTLKTEGEYRDDQLNGGLEEYFESGKIKFKCRYNDGKPTGRCYEFYPDGKPKSSAQYREGRRHGEYKEYYENGKLKIQAAYREGKEDGLKILYHDTGTVIERRQFKDGKLDGIATDHFPNGDVNIEMTYRDGKLNGPWKMYYLSGKVRIERTLEDDKVTGFEKEYYENGPLKSKAYYLDNLREGDFRVFYPNGKLKFIWKFEKGGKHGPFKFLDENEMLLCLGEFEQSRDVRYQLYGSNGKQIADIDLTKDGIRMEEVFDEQGTRSQVYYDAKEQIILTIKYSPSGELLSISP